MSKCQMNKHDNKYREELEKKEDNARIVLASATPIGSWSYGFFDGWYSALDSNFDDRKALAKWRQSSKHLQCPCSEINQCTKSCPHGRAYMSGICIWCAEKFREMEKGNEV
jgi:hypothetical protein